jgi:hypothetical protein
VGKQEDAEDDDEDSFGESSECSTSYIGQSVDVEELQGVVFDLVDLFYRDQLAKFEL